MNTFTLGCLISRVANRDAYFEPNIGMIETNNNGQIRKFIENFGNFLFYKSLKNKAIGLLKLFVYIFVIVLDSTGSRLVNIYRNEIPIIII